MQKIINNKKAILAGAVGNFIEVYDYSHYMYFAPIMATIFFPQNNPAYALTYAYFIYALERLIRPISGVLIGRYVDNHGRRKALNVSVVGMVIAGILMCILPTYQSIGLLAPVLLLMVRIIQGIFISGEFVISMVYITEHAPESRKGTIGSISFLSGIIGAILSSIMSFIIIHTLPKQQVADWGWRIPYLLGLFILLSTYNLRKNLLETPAFIETTRFAKTTVKNTLRKHYKEILFCFSLSALAATNFSMFLTYMPSYLNLTKKLGFASSVALTSINLGFYALLLPLMGYIADKIGSARLILFSIIGIFIFTYPVFYLLNTSTTVFFMESVLLSYMLLLAGLNGSLPAFLCGLFPTSARVTSLAIGYGISLSIFAGITPLASIYLTELTSNVNAPAIYIMCYALFAMLFISYKMKYRLNLQPI